MTCRLLLVGMVIGASALSAGSIRAAACDPEGNVNFICGVGSPEDLLAIPRSDWVLASGYVAGGLHLISTRDFTTIQVFPTDSPRLRPDTTTYPSCPGPIDPAEKEDLSAHGLNLRPGSDEVHTVYMVHHGFRESVEVFEIDTGPEIPTLAWVGCVVAPETTSLNSVSPLPDGGFVVTNLAGSSVRNIQQRLLTGSNTGEVWEWHPQGGWSIVPGSESPAPNGIEASPDGKWLYVNLWSAAKVMRLSRGQTPIQKEIVDLPFHPDNIRWQTDGSLFAAGQSGPTLERVLACLNTMCADLTSDVAEIDPETLAVRELVRYPAKPWFFTATSALQVGQDIWIGSMRGDRIARYPIK